MKLSDVKRANPEWFSKENKRLFNDISYKVVSAKGNCFLVIETYGWTDMFGGPKVRHFRVKGINPDLSMGETRDAVFYSLEEVREFLRGEVARGEKGKGERVSGVEKEEG